MMIPKNLDTSGIQFSFPVRRDVFHCQRTAPPGGGHVPFRLDSDPIRRSDVRRGYALLRFLLSQCPEWLRDGLVRVALRVL
jgi:hypothetical protein